MRYGRNETLSLAVALVAVSTSAILIRLCVSAPTVIAWTRLIGAGAIFLLVAALRGGLGMTRRDWVVALVSALFLALHFYLWIASLFMTSINSAVMLLAAQPLFALALQPIVLGTPITRRNILSLTLGIAGVAVITGADLHVSAMAGRGDVYAIISAAMAASYLISGSWRRAPLIGYLGVMYMLSGLMLLTAGAIMGAPLLPERAGDWRWIALLVLVPTLIGHTLLNRAMHDLPAYVVNLAVLVEPVLTAIFAWIVFRAVVTPSLWVGGALVMFAVGVEFAPRRM